MGHAHPARCAGKACAAQRTVDWRWSGQHTAERLFAGAHRPAHRPACGPSATSFPTSASTLYSPRLSREATPTPAQNRTAISVAAQASCRHVKRDAACHARAIGHAQPGGFGGGSGHAANTSNVNAEPHVPMDAGGVDGDEPCRIVCFCKESSGSCTYSEVREGSSCTVGASYLGVGVATIKTSPAEVPTGAPAPQQAEAPLEEPYEPTTPAESSDGDPALPGVTSKAAGRLFLVRTCTRVYSSMRLSRDILNRVCDTHIHRRAAQKSKVSLHVSRCA